MDRNYQMLNACEIPGMRNLKNSWFETQIELHREKFKLQSDKFWNDLWDDYHKRLNEIIQPNREEKL